MRIDNTQDRKMREKLISFHARFTLKTCIFGASLLNKVQFSNHEQNLLLIKFDPKGSFAQFFIFSLVKQL